MNKILLIICFAALSTASFAQGDDRKEDKKCALWFDILMGLNLTSIHGDGESWQGLLPGGFFGVGTNLMCFSEEIKLRTEVAFSMQGSPYESYQYEPGGGSSTSNGSKVRLNYLVVPITLAYTGKRGIGFEGGFQPGVLVSAKDKHEGGNENVKEFYNGFDLGFVAGINYRPKNKRLGVGLRVIPGLSNINSSDNMYAGKDRNMNLSLRMAYKL